MKPCCDKAARGIVCEHLRDALIVAIERLRDRGVPPEETVRMIIVVLDEEAERRSR